MLFVVSGFSLAEWRIGKDGVTYYACYYDRVRT
jgi:hypothetical protein